MTTSPLLPFFDRVDSNFSFLILEVTSQVENVRGFLQRPSSASMRRIVGRDDYVDSLKRLVEEQCFRALHESRDLPEQAAHLLRAVNIVAENLERIGDLCINILGQAAHLEDAGLSDEPALEEGLTEVLASLQLVRHALLARNVPLAMRICEAESKLDRQYTQVFERVLSGLDSSSSKGDLITRLNIVHYVERMGDLLLNIGEAILFAALGARLKVGDYVALAGLLETAELASSSAEVQVESIWDSRSGARIRRVLGDEDRRTPDLIVKEGSPEKLTLEHDSLGRWQKLRPGLAPRVFGYHQNEQMAALLMEHLHGQTLQAIMLAGSEQDLQRAYARLAATVSELWRGTRKPEPVTTDYIGQVRARLDDIRRLHPSFFVAGKRIGSLSTASLEELLGRMPEGGESLKAPFTVLIHGDFNTNNIIYDEQTDRIHFVDLYRSGEGDFIQDASVFLVSCFRTPVFDRKARARLSRVAGAFLRLVREFALENGDEDVERRLALGLVRSLLTSTRFVPDKLLAEQLFVRAVYLMGMLEGFDKARSIRVPEEILVWRGLEAA